MHRATFISRTVLAFLTCAAIPVAVRAQHEDDQWVHDRQPPYAGRGLDGGGPALSSMAFASNNVELLSWLTVTQFGSQNTSANTVEGYVSQSGTEYALIGLSHGTGFVRLANPSTPVIVGFISGPTSDWRDIRTFGRYAYMVSEGGNGIQVVDLNNLDTTGPVFVRNVTTPTGSNTSTHTVYVNQASGYLYRAGGGGTLGIRIYNLNADASNPSYVTTYGTRYVHECQVITYTSGPYAGKEIGFLCTNDASGGGNPRLTIVDLSNKASIVQLADIAYSNARFSHQSWISDDRRYVYLNDELDESGLGFTSRTRVFDVQNLSTAFEVGWFTNGNTAIDHNLYCKGNLIYCGNYRSGLRIYDTTNSATSPTEIGYFDTYPPDDNANFNGVWDNYPYLPSGIVLGSDIEKGLFVWWVGPAQLAFSYPNGRPTLVNPGGPTTIRVQIAPQGGGSVAAGTPLLNYDIGAGFVSVPLTPVSGNLYDGVIPAVPCGQAVTYYFSARNTLSNIIWRDPTAGSGAGYVAYSATSLFTVSSDTMETSSGWTGGVAGDTATTGQWVRVNPVGTAAQPEDDHTPNPGTVCWVTGQGAVGGALGDADVDGGLTTLLSPTIDLSSVQNPYLSYWRWYSNSAGANPGQDVFRVQISNNNGSTWTAVETVGPSGAEASGGWFNRIFRVSDVVIPTAQVRLRFIAEDAAPGSIVEAAVDDFEVISAACDTPCPGDADSDGDVDQDDLDLILFNFGQSVPPGTGGDLDGDGDVDQDDLDQNLFNFGATCS